MEQEPKPLAGLVPAVLARAGVTSEPLTIQATTPKGNLPPLPKFKFDTFGEPELMRMLSETQKFAADLANESCQRWLSCIGKSGTGKTHLMRQTCDWWDHVRTAAEPWDRPKMRFAWVNWPKVIGQGMTRDRNMAGSIADWSEFPVLFLDEIGSDRDRSEWVADCLSRLLSGRVGKPTFVTSNCTHEQLGQIDVRIASRVIRDENKLVEIEQTIDYALRR